MNISSYYDFKGAKFPKSSDGTPLASFVLSKFTSNDQIGKLFEVFRYDSEEIIDRPNSDLNRMFPHILPINFYNHLSMANGVHDKNIFFTPCQRLLMKHIQGILLEYYGKPKYTKLLYYFALHLSPTLNLNPHIFRFCGEILLKNSKRFGVLREDKKVEIYKDSHFEPLQITTPAKLPIQRKEWEMTKVEISSDIYSPSIAVFRSFSASKNCRQLPIIAYSGFIDYIVSPELLIVSQMLKQNIVGIETPLLTIFLHKNCHRRLLKYCIYEDVFSTEDPSQLLRRNTIEAKIVIEFLHTQIKPIIETALNPIKVDVCKTKSFDANSADDMDVISPMVESFIASFVKILPSFNSAVRFVCRCIYETCQLRFEDHGCRGVFMAFLFRVVFPILCQPLKSDPPDLVVDIKKMAGFGKIMTYIFAAETNKSLMHLHVLAEILETDIQQIFRTLISCPESYDSLECPSITKAFEMVDEIRKVCLPSIGELTFSSVPPSQILIQWLKCISTKDFNLLSTNEVHRIRMHSQKNDPPSALTTKKVTYFTEDDACQNGNTESSAISTEDESYDAE